MKLSRLVFLLILLFSVNSWAAQELSKEEVAEVLRDSNSGNIKAQAYLGGMYYNGIGVPVDYIEAAKWWRKAAEQNSAFAQVNLGRMIHDGKSVPKDFVEAVKWYRKAAEQGNVDGQLELGRSFYNGEGMTQDYAEAEKWFRKAAEQGKTEAREYLYKIRVNESKAVPEQAKAPRQAKEYQEETPQTDRTITRHHESDINIVTIFKGLPFIGLMLAGILFLFYLMCKEGLFLFVACGWAVFGIWEALIQIDDGCAGDCNIRIDILLFPLGLLITLLSLIIVGIKHVSNTKQLPTLAENNIKLSPAIAEENEWEGEINQNSKTIASLMWASSVFMSFIPSLFCYLSMKNDPYIQHHSKDALNFEITLMIATLCGSMFALLGLFDLSVLIFGIIVICSLIVCIMGADAAAKGQTFRVPFAIRLI